jgi:hypothetical protein
MEIGLLHKNYTFKLQMTLDRHSPRLKLNDSPLPDPSHFSLPSSFKEDTVVLKKVKLTHLTGHPEVLAGTVTRLKQIYFLYQLSTVRQIQIK